MNDVNGTCWVRLLNIHNEDNVTYRDTRVGTLETLELDEHSLKLQQQTEEKTKREDFSFERHVNIENKNLSKDQLNQALCNKYETIFSRHSNDLRFNNQIEHQIKLKPDAQPFRRTYGNMSSDKRKAMKKTVEGLAEADLINCTNSFRLGGYKHIGPKKGRVFPIGCCLPGFKQTDRKNVLAVTSHKRCNRLFRRKHVLFEH